MYLNIYLAPNQETGIVPQNLQVSPCKIPRREPRAPARTYARSAVEGESGIIIENALQNTRQSKTSPGPSPSHACPGYGFTQGIATTAPTPHGRGGARSAGEATGQRCRERWKTGKVKTAPPRVATPAHSMRRCLQARVLCENRPGHSNSRQRALRVRS